MTKQSNTSLGGLIKIAIVLDLAWAAILATLNSLVLNQAGIAIGADGIATKVAAGATWLSAFVVGLVQGGIFMVFGFILLVVWVFLYAQFTKGQGAAVWKKLFIVVGLAVLGWGLLQGVKGAAIIAGLGSAPALHASTTVVVAAATLTFIVNFVYGLLFGAVAVTVGSGGLFVVLVAFAAITGGKKSQNGAGNNNPPANGK
ncbi:MAG: hypothetical protein K2W82_17415 [Candidatus Obscuribacterales bacterium]|nr:hypothetical protein [Candidatus Obscuribacterales bacterium]